MKTWKHHPLNAPVAKVPDRRSPRGFAHATPTAHVHTPPGHVVQWSAAGPPPDGELRSVRITVEAATWFDARAEACRQLNCGLGQVEVRRIG